MTRKGQGKQVRSGEVRPCSLILLGGAGGVWGLGTGGGTGGVCERSVALEGHVLGFHDVSYGLAEFVVGDFVGVATYGAWRLERAGQRLAAGGVPACRISPISWVHHLIWLVLTIGALVVAGRWKLAAAWYVVLVPGLPALGADAVRVGLSPAAFWHLVTDLPGLTAVAAVFCYPCSASVERDRPRDDLGVEQGDAQRSKTHHHARSRLPTAPRR